MLITSVFENKKIRWRLLLAILGRIIRRQPHPFRAVSLLKQLVEKRRSIHGLPKIYKYVRSQDRYFWGSDSPGWPSAAFVKFIDNELDRILPDPPAENSLQTVIFAITSRCPLQCRHCYEWNNLDAKEHLALSDLEMIMEKIRQQGIRHVQLSGGEPLVRFDEMLRLVEKYGRDIDFWILTSGFGLTSEKAEALSRVGLTGANISLDHWDPVRHNSFRNHDRSFYWAKAAVANCRRAGLAVSLSLCAARSFVTRENLDRYLALSKEWQVDFIRVLEPRQAGRFTGPETKLSEEEITLLDSFYLATNSSPASSGNPIVSYPGYHQRRAGCFGAGNRYLYIDSRGDFHACPFCLGKQGNALKDSFETAIAAMKGQGCHVFPSNQG
ncbi:MAG: radical SAM protein [bacterium]|nr:radical SAM protein [bacterium]